MRDDLAEIFFQSFFLFLFWIFSILFIQCGNFGSPYLSKATAAAGAALPILNSARGIFVCPNKGIAANAWDLPLTCAPMLLLAIAHGGCTDTARESALQVDSGRKIPCRTGVS